MGVAPGDVEALRAVPMEQLIEAATNLGTASPSSGGLSFQPVVDGTSLPQPPLDAIDGGSADGVRVIVGTNLHEITLFNMLDPQLGGITVDGVAPLLEPWYGGQSPEIVADYASRRPDAVGRGAVDGCRHRRRVPRPRDPAGRSPAQPRRRLHVPVHLGDAGVRRTVALHARARDPVRVRQPRPRYGAVHRRRARASATRRRDAPRVGRVRAHGRSEPPRHPGVAGVRRRPARDHALRRDTARSSTTR